MANLLKIDPFKLIYGKVLISKYKFRPINCCGNCDMIGDAA